MQAVKTDCFSKRRRERKKTGRETFPELMKILIILLNNSNKLVVPKSVPIVPIAKRPVKFKFGGFPFMMMNFLISNLKCSLFCKYKRKYFLQFLKFIRWCETKLYFRNLTVILQCDNSTLHKLYINQTETPENGSVVSCTLYFSPLTKLIYYWLSLFHYIVVIFDFYRNNNCQWFHIKYYGCGRKICKMFEYYGSWNISMIFKFNLTHFYYFINF